jgi:AcrR family transcriptional regulator
LRKQHRQDRRRQAILDAAGALLEEQGIERFSVPSVAARAHMSKPSVYYYFETREAIVLSLAARALSRETAVLESALDAPSGIEAIEAVLVAFVSHYLAQPQLFELLYLWPAVIGASAELLEKPEYPRSIALRERLAKKLGGADRTSGSQQRAQAIATLVFSGARGVVGDALARNASAQQARGLALRLARALEALAKSSEGDPGDA